MYLTNSTPSVNPHSLPLESTGYSSLLGVPLIQPIGDQQIHDQYMTQFVLHIYRPIDNNGTLFGCKY